MDRLANPNMPSHPLDETLEAYVFKRLTEPELDSLEDHLLLCETCRVRLQETETYIGAFRQAGRKLREEEFFRTGQPSFWEHVTNQLGSGLWNRVTWGSGLAVAALGVVLLIPGTQTAPVAYQDVTLTTTRGPEMPSGRSSESWLRLHLNIQHLRAFSSAVVQIVDASGKELWQSKQVKAAAGDAEIVIVMDRKLAKGNYWVRLASSEAGQLLREYPLQVK